MKRKSSAKEDSSSSNVEKRKEFSLKKFVFLNWIPIVLTLIIILATIIIVPIIYTLKPTESQNKSKSYSWNSSGITLINRTLIFDKERTTDTLGLISSIYFDREQHLNILDKSKHRLIRWSNETSSIVSLRVGHINGREGNDSYSLNQPNDIYIDEDLQIYIVDTFNDRIQYFTKDNQSGSTLEFQMKLNRPMSITMDKYSNILYISDYGNHRILQFNRETNENRIFIDHHPNGYRNSYLLDPISIRYDETTKSLCIAQEKSFNVVRWFLNSSRWNLIGGSRNSDLSGTSRTLFKQLCSINLDQRGQIYVVDCNNQRIQFFDKDLSKGKTILGVIEASGNNSYLFSYPTSITFDDNTNLFVADSRNYRIQFFPMT